MVIRLTSDIEAALAREAQRQGITPEQLAIDTLAKSFLEAPSGVSSGRTSLFDYLYGYIGTIEGISEALSENCGRHG